MTAQYETYPGLTSLMTTGLNSLANGSRAVSSTVNNSDRKLFIDLELFVNTQGSSRSSSAHVLIYALASADNTNFTYGSSSLDPPASALLCTMQLDAATSSRYVIRVRLPAPPAYFKLLVKNNTGQAFASSGNTLKYALYTLQS